MTVEELCARAAIGHTLSIYNNAGDRGAAEEFAGAFAEDGWLQVWGEKHQGREAIAAFARNISAGTRQSVTDGRKPFVRHHITTSRIEISGEFEAKGWTYFIIVSNAGLKDTGVYVDQFVKAGDRWLLQSRRVKIDGED